MRSAPFVLLSAPVKERDLVEIADLLQADPWQRRRWLPGEIAEHVGSAARVVRAVDPDDGRLLGVGWVLSDGLGSGYRADVFVAEDRRREGIGATIVRHLGSTPRVGHPTWLLGHDSGAPYPRPLAGGAGDDVERAG
jgi:GNAT superfamily N-acetyltransferase